MDAIFVTKNELAELMRNDDGGIKWISAELAAYHGARVEKDLRGVAKDGREIRLK